MNYRTFGRRSGLRVSQLALSANYLGMQANQDLDGREAKRIFEGYVNAGGNFIDASDRGGGASESLIGRLVGRGRDHFVISSDFSEQDRLDRNPAASSGGSRKSIIRQVEASLSRLDTDRIDIAWVRLSTQAPVDEVLRAVDDLVRDGKVLHIGLTDSPTWLVARADVISDLNGWAPILGIRLTENDEERARFGSLLSMTAALGLGVVLASACASSRSELRHLDEAPTDDSTPREFRRIPSRRCLSVERQLHMANDRSTTIIPTLFPRTRSELDDMWAGVRPMFPRALGYDTPTSVRTPRVERGIVTEPMPPSDFERESH